MHQKSKVNDRNTLMNKTQMKFPQILNIPACIITSEVSENMSIRNIDKSFFLFDDL